VNKNNLGSLWKRVGGATIDFAIIMLLAWIAVYAWAAFIVANQSDIGMDSQTQKEMWKARGLVIGLGIDFLYSVLLQGSSRQRTFGQQVFSLKLTRLNGETVTYPRAAARYFVSLISSIVIKLGFLSAVFSKNKQTFHDLVTGTVVVNDNKIQEQSKNIIQQPSMATNDHYAMAMNEFEGGEKQVGLWAKCYAEAKGDEPKAKAAYIESRAREISKFEKDVTETVATLNLPVRENSTKAEKSKVNMQYFYFTSVIIIFVATGLFIAKKPSKSNEEVEKVKFFNFSICRYCVDRNCETTLDKNNIVVNRVDETVTVNGPLPIASNTIGFADGCKFGLTSFHSVKCDGTAWEKNNERIISTIEFDEFKYTKKTNITNFKENYSHELIAQCDVK